ncbi:hypothetical protein ACJMK2_028886 [Sinanodonta woodiana]|uniref:Sex-determining region Y protein n=1 Tax=Sinanodonta woodiana TaxID=1069815 RepID=A0ABD3XAG2_SINWO
MNAFMMFANETRPLLRQQYPDATNKEISVKLGECWAQFSIEEKAVYYAKAKVAEKEHAMKFPEYKYCPSVSKLVKAVRKQEDKQRRVWIKSNVAIQRLTQQKVSAIKASGSSKKSSSFNSRYPVHIAPKPVTEYHIRMSSNQSEEGLVGPGPDGVICLNKDECLKIKTSNSSTLPTEKPRRRRKQALAEVSPNKKSYQLHKLFDHEENNSKTKSAANMDDSSRNGHESHEGNANKSKIGVKSAMPFHIHSKYSTALPVLTTMHQDEMNSSSDENKDSDYVLVPCDINLARMLGWPVHLLQKCPPTWPIFDIISDESESSNDSVDLLENTDWQETQPSLDYSDLTYSPYSSISMEPSLESEESSPDNTMMETQCSADVYNQPVNQSDSESNLTYKIKIEEDGYPSYSTLIQLTNSDSMEQGDFHPTDLSMHQKKEIYCVEESPTGQCQEEDLPNVQPVDTLVSYEDLIQMESPVFPSGHVLI